MLGSARAEHLEDGIRGGDAVGRGVEVETDLAQRLVDLGRDHEDEQGGGQVHAVE